MRRIILVKSNSYRLEENARKTRQNAGKMYKRSRKTDVFVNMRTVQISGKATTRSPRDPNGRQAPITNESMRDGAWQLIKNSPTSSRTWNAALSSKLLM